MHRLILGSSGNVDLHPTVERGDLESEVAAVGLESVRLTHLKTREAGREGVLSFAINGQPSTFGWTADSSGSLQNPGQFEDQLLFLGPHDGLLEISAAVVESASDVNRRLSRIQSTLALATSVTSIFGGPGALATGGIGLAGALVEALSKRQEDDVELLFQGSIGSFGEESSLLQLKRGSYAIRRNSPLGNDILLVFRVLPFQPLEENREVIVLLDSIELELHRLQRQLVFEASLGSGRNRMQGGFEAPLKNGPATIDSLLGIQNQLLYRGPWKLGIPFHFNLTTLTRRDSSALREVVAEAGSLTRQLLDTSPARALASDITRAVQSLRSMLIEYLPEKKSIGRLDGHLCSSRSTDSLNPEEKRVFRTIEPSDRWQEFSFDLETAGVGRARLNLRAKALSA